MGMKLLKANGQSLETDSFDVLIDVLKNDGIICFPAENNYRLGASAVSHPAVSALIAAKRRSAHAPALIFVSGLEMLEQVAAPLPTLWRERALIAEAAEREAFSHSKCPFLG